jgi:hypothetical protein
LASGGVTCRREQGVSDGAHGVEGGLSGDARGAGDGSEAGMDGGVPWRAEAAGDFPEHDGRSDLWLGDVVRGADAAVLEEDEEFGPPRVELGLQHRPSGCGAAMASSRSGRRWASTFNA